MPVSLIERQLSRVCGSMLPAGARRGGGAGRGPVGSVSHGSERLEFSVEWTVGVAASVAGLAR